MNQNTEPFNVQYPPQILEQELDFILSSTWEEGDWDEGELCKSVYQLSNMFSSRESAKITIRRILMAHNKFHSGT